MELRDFGSYQFFKNLPPKLAGFMWSLCRIEKRGAQLAVYHSSECETEVREWSDQCAAFQGSPVALLGSCTESLDLTHDYGADRSHTYSKSYLCNFYKNSTAHAVKIAH